LSSSCQLKSSFNVRSKIAKSTAPVAICSKAFLNLFSFSCSSCLWPIRLFLSESNVVVIICLPSSLILFFVSSIDKIILFICSSAVALFNSSDCCKLSVSMDISLSDVDTFCAKTIALVNNSKSAKMPFLKCVFMFMNDL